MAKPKQSGRPSNKAKAVSQPETPDDFQELADEEEARGGKWRAGDINKSARAFERAITFYDQGLQRFPDNFDLAYNKARLELEVSQQPALLPHWGQDRAEFLAQALISHQKALRINDDDVDVLFNTAQVMTSLAEELSKKDRDHEAVPLLHSALELLSSCLAKQELMLEQQSVDFTNDDLEEGGVSLKEVADTTTTTERNEESATVIQPVTPTDLLDTVHASLSALTTLAGLEDEQAFSNLDGMARALYETKARSYLAVMTPEEQSGAKFSVDLDRAVFICALANARFEAYEIDVRTFLDQLDSFDIVEKASHANALAAEAEARIDAVLSAMEQLNDKTPILELWKQLAISQEVLSEAVKLNDDDAKELKPQLYKQKGDIELLRIKIASLPTPFITNSMKDSRSTLLKNSRAFYKGALSIAISNDDELKDILVQRMLAVEFLFNIDTGATPVIGTRLLTILSSLVQDGLLDAGVVNLIPQI